MKKKLVLNYCAFLLVGLLLSTSNCLAANGAGVYGGGPIYKDRSVSISNLRESGFKWVCVWTIHIEQNGDLGYNGEFNLVQNGTYIGDQTYPNFPSDMELLKTAPTSIEWIEFGLSGAGSGTFNAVRDLVNSEGTGPGSTLYRNFSALRDAIPAIDAFSFNDENTYHEPSTTQFAIMLADLGFKVSICPYTRSSHWQNVVSNVNNSRPGTIEDVHLQCYAGGGGNNPCTWNGYFPSNINVMPGVEDGSNIASRISGWNNQCGITGGWVWLYDDFYTNLSNVQSYASAINNNITPVSTDPPRQATNPSPSNGVTDVSTSTSLSWSAGTNATSHDVYFGTDSTPDSGELQGNQSGTTFAPGSLATNTTYYWRVDEVNSVGTTTGNVWSFTTTSSVSVDHTDPVGTGTITARAEINSNEAATMAFDNLYVAGTQNTNWSKWLDNGGTPSSSNPSWIQIQLPNQVVVNKLAIISANDDHGRDPEDFKLQGSNNGSTWTQLGNWSSINWSNRFERMDFNFTNSTPYSYYRLNITRNDENVNMTQLCEIMLIGPEGSSSIPVANFSANSTSILVGESISFTDNSSNTPTSWSWTFEGGSPSSSTSQNPTVTYNTEGSYDVTLTVSNADGSDSKTKSNFITVNSSSGNSIDFNNVTIVSYSNQDSDGSFSILDGGSTLLLQNNTWKRTNETYNVTSNTVLEFEFMSNNRGEIHGIGLDENNSHSSNRIFKLYGSQNWGISGYDTYNNTGSYESYQIPVGSHYTGSNMYLVFINDYDNGSGNNSYFRNVRLFESSTLRSASSTELLGTDSDELITIKVFPNPTTDNVNINYVLDVEANVTIKIFDSNGNIVDQFNRQTQEKGNYTQTWNTANINSGIYICKITIGSTTVNKKIVVLK